jgi:hypothetical protein
MTDAISSILDGTLDDLADLPGFKVPPTGGYAVSIVSNTVKTVGTHVNTVEAKFKIKEVLEISEQGVDEKDMPLAGDEFAVLFMTDNETGAGFLKEYLKVIGPAVGSQKTKEILELSKGLDLVVVTKRTYNKDADRHNVNLKKITVL